MRRVAENLQASLASEAPAIRRSALAKAHEALGPIVNDPNARVEEKDTAYLLSIVFDAVICKDPAAQVDVVTPKLALRLVAAATKNQDLLRECAEASIERAREKFAKNPTDMSRILAAALGFPPARSVALARFGAQVAAELARVVGESVERLDASPLNYGSVYETLRQDAVKYLEIVVRFVRAVRSREMASIEDSEAFFQLDEVRDLARACARAATSKHAGSAFALGRTSCLTVFALAEGMDASVADRDGLRFLHPPKTVRFAFLNASDDVALEAQHPVIFQHALNGACASMESTAALHALFEMIHASRDDATSSMDYLRAKVGALRTWTGAISRASATISNDCVSRATQLALVYANHADDRVSNDGLASLAILIEITARIDPTSLPRYLNNQLRALESSDLPPNKGFFPSLETILNLIKLDTKKSTEVIALVFRKGFPNDIVGNQACNLLLSHFRRRLNHEAEGDLAQGIDLLWKVLLQGPSNVTASGFVGRRLVVDLLGDRGMSKRATLVGFVLKSMKATATTVDVSKLDWATLVVLGAIQKGGETNVLDHLTEETVKRCVLHYDGKIRTLVWGILAPPVFKANEPPTPRRLALILSSLTSVLSSPSGTSRDQIADTLRKFLLRCAETLAHNSSNESTVEYISRFVSDFVTLVGHKLYSGGTSDATQVSVTLLTSAATVLQPSLRSTQSVVAQAFTAKELVHAVLQCLKSSFDSTRMLAYQYLSVLPSDIAGVAAGPLQLDELLVQHAGLWDDLAMRRVSDAGALLVRLAHKQGCLDSGWIVQVPQWRAGRTQEDYMIESIFQARRCTHSDQAFDVGCVVTFVSRDGAESVAAVGYSRELPGNTHAEECALMKLETQELPAGVERVRFYVTMEPCSTRLSKKDSCTDRILRFKEKHPNVKMDVVMGGKEPDTFVVCEGEAKLVAAGIPVTSAAQPCVVEECRATSVGKSHLARPQHAAAASLLFIHHLLDEIEARAKVPGGRLSLHTGLAAVKYVMADAPWSSFELDAANEAARRIVAVALAASVACSRVCGASSEDSRLNDERQYLDCRGHVVAGLNSSDSPNGTTSAEAAAITMRAWLGLRESSNLIGAALQTFELGKPTGISIPIPLVQAVASWYINSLLSLRHIGSVGHVGDGIEHIASRLLRCGTTELEAIPGQWMTYLLGKLRESGFDRSLRRSEGFGRGFRAVSVADAGGSSSDAELAKRALDGCLSVAEEIRLSGEDSNHTSRVAALNVLRGLVCDAVLSRHVLDFVSRAMTEAVLGFSSPVWGIRNSSLNLYSALVRRSVGDGAHSVVAEAKSNIFMTPESFFSTFPSMKTFLLDRLSEASTTASLTKRPIIHPILVLFSSMRRVASKPRKNSEEEAEQQPDDDVDTEAVLAALREPVRTSASSHSHYMIRTAAARASRVLFSARDVCEKDVSEDVAFLLDAAADGAHWNRAHGVVARLGAIFPDDVSSETWASTVHALVRVGTTSPSFAVRFAAIEALLSNSRSELVSLESGVELLKANAVVELDEVPDAGRVGKTRSRVMAGRLAVSVLERFPRDHTMQLLFLDFATCPGSSTVRAETLEEFIERYDADATWLTRFDADFRALLFQKCMSLPRFDGPEGAARLRAACALLESDAACLSIAEYWIPNVEAALHETRNPNIRNDAALILSFLPEQSPALRALWSSIAHPKTAARPVAVELKDGAAQGLGQALAVLAASSAPTELEVLARLALLQLLDDDDEYVRELARRSAVAVGCSDTLIVPCVLAEFYESTVSRCHDVPLLLSSHVDALFAALPQKDAESASEEEGKVVNLYQRTEELVTKSYCDASARVVRALCRLRSLRLRQRLSGTDDAERQFWRSLAARLLRELQQAQTLNVEFPDDYEYLHRLILGLVHLGDPFTSEAQRLHEALTPALAGSIGPLRVAFDAWTAQLCFDE